MRITTTETIRKAPKMNRVPLRLLIGTLGFFAAILLVGARQSARADVAQALNFKDQTVYYPEVRPGLAEDEQRRTG